jgi:hypothetical protein
MIHETDHQTSTKYVWLTRICVVLVVCTLASLYGNFKAVRILEKAAHNPAVCIVEQTDDAAN